MFQKSDTLADGREEAMGTEVNGIEKPGKAPQGMNHIASQHPVSGSKAKVYLHFLNYLLLLLQ